MGGNDTQRPDSTFAVSGRENRTRFVIRFLLQFTADFMSTLEAIIWR